MIRHAWKHARNWWIRHSLGMPRWEDDKTAAMLGVSRFGCPSCGYGAIEERDATREDQP